MEKTDILTIKSDRKYPSFVELSQEMLNGKKLFVITGDMSDMKIDLSKVIGNVLQVKEKRKKTYITWNLLKPLELSNYTITPVGVGTVENKKVTDYKLIAFKLDVK